MKAGFHHLVIDFFGLLTLAFNGLLLYSLFANKDSVTIVLWVLLLVREIFGFLYFTAVYSRKWFFGGHYTYQHVNDEEEATDGDETNMMSGALSTTLIFVYFIMLFGFALAELIILVKDDNATAKTTVNIPLPIFAWFFLVVDWLFVFSVFVMGVFVYDDMVPSFLLYAPETN